MIQSDINCSLSIDRLTRSRFSFALYRLPWTDEPILILQDRTETETFNDLKELNGKEGFVLAPFISTPGHPIVLIHPDYVKTGWRNISDTLKQFDDAHPVLCTDSERTNNGIETITDDADRKSRYVSSFNRFIAPLQNNVYSKLVLSRRATQELPENFSPLHAFIKACDAYPRMMISLCHTPITGTWIGSTPEIILSGHDTQWHTVALAGTMPIENETIPMKWSRKNREEQAYVSEYLRSTLKQFGDDITEKGPYTARAGQLVHLKTDFYFRLNNTLYLGDILKRLHPTPAVCGLPKAEAYHFISETEGYDRAYYSGIIGLLSPHTETQLYVNLRCMHIGSSTTTLFAGSGILPSSTAESEWDETCEKMKTMQRIL